MKVYTSYFAKERTLRKSEILPIGIAVRPPEWFNGPTLFELAPTTEMLVGTMKGTMTLKEYDRLFMARLKNLNAMSILKQIKMIASERDVALLCFEKDRSECHRDMVAKWMEAELGIEVKEFIDKEEEKKRRIEEMKRNQTSMF